MEMLSSTGVLLWVFIVMITLMFSINLFRRSDAITGVYSPIDVLNKKYAKGDISKEEYERIKKAIK